MLPSLADLDIDRLSPHAREALLAAQEIGDGSPLEEAAAARGLTAKELQRRLDTLAAEWRDQTGLARLPRLDEDDYEALRESIAEHGQLVPIIVGADGSIVDGHGRARACHELGLEPHVHPLPAELDSDELRSLALVVNLARRHLTTSARRGIVRDQLLADPSRSDRAVAVAVGVSPTTVGSVRKELEQAGVVSNLDTRVGRDGIRQPAAKQPRQPEPEAELPDGLVDLTLRLTADYAAELDGGAWLDCRAVRLVLVAAGTYTLEVRR